VRVVPIAIMIPPPPRKVLAPQMRDLMTAKVRTELGLVMARL
jgi:hypothetical protein